VQFSELQKLSDLDRGSGQGHISISACTYI